MMKHHFSSLPSQAFVSFGGFTWVRSDAWRKYLNRTIRARYPKYALKYMLHQHDERRWQDNNCIFASLVEYLFVQFGVLVPEDSLFKIYNPRGEGVSPDQIINAIMAVIEPLGFEIEKVLVPDDELRKALGHSEYVVDMSHASDFNSRAGLCMINIKSGYSHAFFWKKMDKTKFSKEQFRMAVLVRRKGWDLSISPSATQCFDQFCQLLYKHLSLSYNPDCLQVELTHLSDYVHDPANWQKPYFRSQVDQGLESILAMFNNIGISQRGRRIDLEKQSINEACLMVRRVFREYQQLF